MIDCTYSTGIQNEGCNIGNRCDYIYEKDDNIGIDLDKDWVRDWTGKVIW